MGQTDIGIATRNCVPYDIDSRGCGGCGENDYWPGCRGEGAKPVQSNTGSLQPRSVEPRAGLLVGGAGLWDPVENLDGVAIGLVNRTRRLFSGVGVGLLNWSDRGPMRGAQVAYVANHVGGDAKGVQASLLFNETEGDMDGIQISALFNRVTGRMRGVQIGLMNVWRSGEEACFSPIISLICFGAPASWLGSPHEDDIQEVIPGY